MMRKSIVVIIALTAVAVSVVGAALLLEHRITLRHPQTMREMPRQRDKEFEKFMKGLRPFWLQSSIGISWVLIPAGDFWMGSPVGETGRHPDEAPRHRIEITRPFYMAQTEITQSQWHRLIGNNPSRFNGCGGHCPVERVTWFEALYFANALSKKEGFEPCYQLHSCKKRPGEGLECNSVSWPKGLYCKGYRLPTEAEWEYAARAQTSTPTYADDYKVITNLNSPSLHPLAWYGGNSGVTYPGGFACSGSLWRSRQIQASLCGTHPVGWKQPNEFFLYDMLGNVLEWCWDWHATTYYYNSPRADPTGPTSGWARVTRGGSFYNDAGDTRAATRDGESPQTTQNSVGFRLVRSLPFY